MKPLVCLLSAIALCTGALLAAAPAGAVGNLVDVNVIDRDSGAPLPIYRHQGQWWVAGQPGARYAIEVRNTTGERVLSVMAVDGVNIVSGETASWDQTGYVLYRWDGTQIAGWRKSDSTVAAFHFTALPNSYAARTGRPDNVGVIGVAVFREKAPPPPAAIAPAPAAASSSLSNQEAPAAGDRSASSASAFEGVARQRAAPATPSPSRTAPPVTARLGTGHGGLEESWITHTDFERRRSQPDEVITIRYDSYQNLVALGVITRDARQARRPTPFPQSPGYTPDPPSYR